MCTVLRYIMASAVKRLGSLSVNRVVSCVYSMPTLHQIRTKDAMQASRWPRDGGRAKKQTLQQATWRSVVLLCLIVK